MDFIFLISANALSAVFNFLANWGLSKIVEPSFYSRVLTCQTYFSILLIVCIFGFDQAIMAVVAQKKTEEPGGQGNLEQNSHYGDRLRRLVATSFIYSVPCAFAAAMVLRFGGLVKDAATADVLFWLTACLPFSAFAIIVQSTLRARDRLGDVSKHQVLTRGIAALGIICGGLTGSFKGFGITFGLGQIFTGLVSSRFLPRSEKSRQPAARGFVRMATITMFSNLIFLLNSRLDLILLDHLNGPTSVVGSYALAAVFSQGFISLSWSFQSFAAARLIRTSSNPRLFVKEAWRIQGWVALGCTILALGIFGIFQQNFFPFVDPRYQDARLFIGPLLLQSVLSMSTLVIYQALFLLGHFRYNFVVTSLALLTNGIFGWLLIPTKGAMGAAIAKLVAELVVFIFATRFLMKEEFRGPKQVSFELL